MSAAFIHCPHCGFPAIVAERMAARRCRQCWREHHPKGANAIAMKLEETKRAVSARRAKLRTHLRSIRLALA